VWGVVANRRPRVQASPGVRRCFYHEPGLSCRYGVISTRIPTGAHWNIQAATSIGKLTQP
jgi:hypothetical protein